MTYWALSARPSLTAALKRTGTPAALTDLVQTHWGRLNAVHVCAALSSLAGFRAESSRRLDQGGGDQDLDVVPLVPTLLDALRSGLADIARRIIDTHSGPAFRELNCMTPVTFMTAMTRRAICARPHPAGERAVHEPTRRVFQHLDLSHPATLGL
jgi:hypothetical protein